MNINKSITLILLLSLSIPLYSQVTYFNLTGLTNTNSLTGVSIGTTGATFDASISTPVGTPPDPEVSNSGNFAFSMNSNTSVQCVTITLSTSGTFYITDNTIVNHGLFEQWDSLSINTGSYTLTDPSSYINMGSTGTSGTSYFKANTDITSYTSWNLQVSATSIEVCGARKPSDPGSQNYKIPISIGVLTATVPVELINFDAFRNKDNVELNWATASEINNSHFEIERSYDGRNFETIGEVSGNGNSQHRIDYSYTDVPVSNLQNTVFYRLKQVDFDGTFEYSDIRVVRFDQIGNKMQLVAYPNPMNDELNVMLSLPSGEKYQLQVTNSYGALVYQKNHLFSSGLHTLDLSQWNDGMYTLKVASDQGTQHIKLMKK